MQDHASQYGRMGGKAKAKATAAVKVVKAKARLEAVIPSSISPHTEPVNDIESNATRTLNEISERDLEVELDGGVPEEVSELIFRFTSCTPCEELSTRNLLLNLLKLGLTPIDSNENPNPKQNRVTIPIS